MLHLPLVWLSLLLIAFFAAVILLLGAPLATWLHFPPSVSVILAIPSPVSPFTLASVSISTSVLSLQPPVALSAASLVIWPLTPFFSVFIPVPSVKSLPLPPF